MADMKIPSGGSQLPAVRPANPARTEALRAAQKAFFDAAMNQAPAPAVQPKAQPATAALAPAAASADQPQRFLRPGSRLDIKV